MKYSHILWDFNGTILNDVKAGFDSANILLERRNKPVLKNLAAYRSLFCFPITEYYTRLGLDLNQEKFHDLAVEWSEQYQIFSSTAELYDGITEALTAIEKRRIPQIVLSASEKGALLKQLEELGVLNFFNTILGLDNIYANSKIDIAVEWIKKNFPEKAILIGDTVHDWEVSRAIGVDCVLIANGHQDRDTLLHSGASVLNSAQELTTWLNL